MTIILGLVLWDYTGPINCQVGAMSGPPAPLRLGPDYPQSQGHLLFRCCEQWRFSNRPILREGKSHFILIFFLAFCLFDYDRLVIIDSSSHVRPSTPP